MSRDISILITKNPPGTALDCEAFGEVAINGTAGHMMSNSLKVLGFRPRKNTLWSTMYC